MKLRAVKFKLKDDLKIQFVNKEQAAGHLKDRAYWPGCKVVGRSKRSTDQSFAHVNTK